MAGEAVGYAMGLVMLGTSSQKALDEMLQYAHETQHEKIIRGLAVGISLLMFGKQEEADALIDTLMADKVGLPCCAARIQADALSTCRTPFSGMEACTRSPWLMPGRAQIRPSAACSTLPSRTSMTTFADLQSHRSGSFCAGRLRRCRVSSSFLASRTTRTFGTAPLSLWALRVRAPACSRPSRFSSRSRRIPSTLFGRARALRSP